MWPFTDSEAFERKRRKQEVQNRWRRIQFWKRKQQVTISQPALGERIVSTYFPIAYLITLCCFIYYAWKRRKQSAGATERPQPLRGNPLVFGKNGASGTAQESINLQSVLSQPGNPDPSLQLSTGSDSSGNIPGDPQSSRMPDSIMPILPMKADAMMTLGSEKLFKSERLEENGEASDPVVEGSRKSKSDAGCSTASRTSKKSRTSKTSKSSRRRRKLLSLNTADETSLLESHDENECHVERMDEVHIQHDSHVGRSTFIGELSTALRRNSFQTSESVRKPKNGSVLEDSGITIGIDSQHHGFRSRSSSPVERRKCMIRELGQEGVDALNAPTEPTKIRRQCRRMSMPFMNSSSSGQLMERENSLRRSKSAEKLVAADDEMPPMIIFPTSKLVTTINDSVTETKNLSLTRRNFHCSPPLACDDDDNGDLVNGGSPCGSFAPSLAGSCFGPAELERLRLTIMRKGSPGGTRRSSIGSISSRSTRDGSVVIAQIELLHKLSGVVGDDASQSGRSVIRSLKRAGSIRSLNTDESNIMDAFYDPKADSPPYLTIYYATQSGTSEYYAYVLQQEGQSMGIDVGICNLLVIMDSIEMSLDNDLQDILVPHINKNGKKRGYALFLVSTYQDGSPTEDGKSFVHAIQQIKDRKYFKGLRYAVFGFGSSTFGSTYNLQGKLYDKVLSELGAKRIVPLSLGDDSKDIDWDVETWKWRSWWPNFADLAARDEHGWKKADDGSNPSKGRKGKQEIESSDVFTVEYISSSQVDKHKRECDQIPLQSVAKHFREGAEYRVKSVKPLWRDPDLSPMLRQSGSTIQVTLDMTSAVGIPLTFKTGDNVAILPHNRARLVEEIAECLGYDLGAIFILKPQDIERGGDCELPFPTPCSVRDFLSLYAELTTPPRRSVIRALSKCASKPEERDEMYRLSSKKHREKYKSQVLDKHIGLGEFITVYFPSVKVPLMKLITLCALMQPRWYSLSGSTVVHKDEIHLTFSMVSVPRDDASFALGAASHYLESLPIGALVRIVRNVASGIVVPTNPSTPLIMIANGAGIAPMLALIQERDYQRTELRVKVGPTELFFGIRRRDLDFLYRDELRRYKLSGSLSSLQLACSREQLHKIYVQHLVVKHAEHLWRLLERGAHIYVCGGSKMSAEVDQVLRAIVTRHLSGNGLLTEEFMARMEHQGRYVREAFDSAHTKK